MGRLERASECTGLKKEGGDAAAWAERLATVRDVPSLLQVGGEAGWGQEGGTDRETTGAAGREGEG